MSEAATNRPILSAIIVSYNTCDLTLECLRTLSTEVAGLAVEIFVVDNASSDGSVDAIREAFPNVKLIVMEKNAGFGAANNAAMQVATGAFFLLLNTDAFPRPGGICAMLPLLQSRPEVGVIGPRLLNRDGTLQRSCFRFPTPRQVWLENLWLSRLFSSRSSLGDYRHWDHATEREVDFVIGACLIVRREVFEQVGGFDERFFMYQEEADWQRRIQAAGWRVLFTPAAQVVHYGGESGRKEPARINRHFFESLDRYAIKHHGVIGFGLIRAAMLIGCSVRAVLWAFAALIPGRMETATSKACRHARLVLRQISTGWPA